jgi:hypothetical protein
MKHSSPLWQQKYNEKERTIRTATEHCCVPNVVINIFLFLSVFVQVHVLYYNMLYS